EAYQRGELVVDPDAISYLDYALYQSGLDRSPSVAYSKEYLDSKRLALSRMVTRIPSDRPWLVNPFKSTHSIPINFRVDDKIVSTMIGCAGEMNVTVASLCLACHFAFLVELTDEWVLEVVCTMANRPLEPEAAKILGPFLHYVLCSVILEKEKNPTFITLLQQTHTTMMMSFDRLPTEQNPLLMDLTEMLADNQPRSSFQFDEKLQDMVLDQNVRLHQLLDPSDGTLAAAWWRLAVYSHFFSLVSYDPQTAELSYVFAFSSAAYERPTAVRMEKHQSLLSRFLWNFKGIPEKMHFGILT
ncbi:unnamed protein product, partial [Didymodactylos carnosus]